MTPSQDSQGRYIAPGESRTAADVSSAARTATANGTAFDTSDLDSNYDTVGSFDQLTNTGAEARVFGGTDTPSFTFSIASTVDRDG